VKVLLLTEYFYTLALSFLYCPLQAAGRHVQVELVKEKVEDKEGGLTGVTCQEDA